ncbi:MAG TPA: PKD domain-containing protein [Candidatus Angelobacter sp.]|nr:PKD domain-containing protein [Candidatus Angelobacter sp.]
MRRYGQILLCSLVLSFSLTSFAGTTFKATTTLTAETANNTSAANSFLSQSNGNLGAANISKMPIRNLLFPGSTAKIYVHLMPWFGFGDHMNVGYSSDDPVQVQRQVNDMVSRGLDGAIIDWFGQGTLTHEFASYSQVVQDFMQDAELQANFNFAIMDDAGSLQACAGTAGCDLTQTLINDLTYAYNNYENSPAYLHYNNQPVVYFFGEEAYTLDWTRIRASVPGNPLFIFRNTGGFTSAQSNGAFSWVAPETVSSSDPMALGYLDNFDKTALSLLPAYSTESGYKGFNDALAAWGTGRLIQQQCGQTWLASMAEAGRFYSATKPMLGIQLVTWNDYEEATELESGIDNCVTLSTQAKGTVVSWSITGQANTLDHYTVFASQDGENLMWLADVSTSVNSLELAQFQLNAGNYTVYVKAVGKPSLVNKMSSGVSLAIPNLPPVAVLSVSPSSGTAPLAVTASTAGSSDPDGSIASTVINFGDGSASVSAASANHSYRTGGTYTVTATVTDNLGASTTKTTTVSVMAVQAFAFSGSDNSATVAAGQAATYNLSLGTRNSGFTGTVSVACAGAPAGTTCSVSPASVNFTANAVSTPVTVTVATTTQARLAPILLLKGLPFTFAAVFAGILGGVKKKAKRAMFAVLAAFLICGVIGCAGGASSTTQAPAPLSPTSATLTVTGTSGGQSATTTLILTITH